MQRAMRIESNPKIGKRDAITARRSRDYCRGKAVTGNRYRMQKTTAQNAGNLGKYLSYVILW
jgi:hypothetical protein